MDTDLSRLSERVAALERRVDNLGDEEWEGGRCELDECKDDDRLEAVEELLRVVRLRPDLLTVEALAAALDGDMTAAFASPVKRSVTDGDREDG